MEPLNYTVARPFVNVNGSTSDRLKNFKTSKSVYFDKFIDVDCSYLEPIELGDHHLTHYKTSEFTIFHNNKRSISRNFNEMKTDLFSNCTKYPDILAFTDTKVKRV